MKVPKISTAIPQRRYQIGDYFATVLGEIESSDGVDYRYILALVEQGQSQPSLYVTSERNPKGQSEEGSHRLRVISEAMTEDLGTSDLWRDLETFVTEGLSIASMALGLAGEEPLRLM
jgi:hypothetical protein